MSAAPLWNEPSATRPAALQPDEPICDCGFWPGLLGDIHQEGACDLLLDREIQGIREECCQLNGGQRKDCYPGEQCAPFYVFDAWLGDHKGPDGLLYFAPEELEPYR